jgi:hypothetical protein
MSSDYDAGRKAGRDELRRDLQPLVTAVQDTLLMFEDIRRARQLPPYGNVVEQYIAMGKQLRRLLDASGLKMVHEQEHLP